jgi:hypothetical protein
LQRAALGWRIDDATSNRIARVRSAAKRRWK